MKNLFILLSLIMVACQAPKEEVVEVLKSPIAGTWQLVYADIKKNDSTTVKDMSQAKFIKIINETHFAFFNQSQDTEESFYGGAGTYTLDGNQYVETLDYIRNVNLRKHEFEFTVKLKGDSLIQTGLEDVPAAGLKRYITEKYIRLEQ